MRFFHSKFPPTVTLPDPLHPQQHGPCRLQQVRNVLLHNLQPTGTFHGSLDKATEYRDWERAAAEEEKGGVSMSWMRMKGKELLLRHTHAHTADRGFNVNTMHCVSRNTTRLHLVLRSMRLINCESVSAVEPDISTIFITSNKLVKPKLKIKT